MNIWVARLIGYPLIALILLGGAYLKGVEHEAGKCTQKSEITYIKQRKHEDEVTKQVMRLSPAELHRARTHWLR